MKIGTKLYVGFGTVGLVLVCAVLITLFQVKRAQTLTDRVIELRAPTALAGTEMLNGVNRSLAALRGWMILGNEKFRDERRIAWQEIDDSLAKMTAFSENWTVEANKQRLTEIKSIFEEFRQAQEEIEAIVQTPANTPATVILIDQAAPLAAIMATEITALIDLEGEEAATAERKALLGMMADVRGTLGLGLANIRAYLLTGDSAFADKFGTLWAKNTRRFGDLTNARNLLTSQQAKSYEEFAQARAKFVPLPPKMFEIRGSAEWNLGNAWLGTKAAPKAARMVEILGEMKENQQGLLATDSEQASATVARLVVLEWILLFVGLLLAFLIAWRITGGITAPLNRMTAMLQDIAEGEGDLTKELEASGKDEVGEAAKWFNLFVGKIRDLIREIASVAEQVASSSAELSSSSTGLASGATEQAANLEETSASIEELNASIQSNAELSQESRKTATECAVQAENGGRAVEETVEAMKRIANQIAIIDDIADQTNLLALNAAIEAARAGEMGKGFAVVAVEVRKLAERSQEAAKEISELASNSVAGAEQAGKLIQGVVPGIQETARIVGEMSSATEEQASGAEQISLAVNQLDQVTQQNASTAEESAAASEELSAQAQLLQEMVGQFKVSADGQTAEPQRQAAPRARHEQRRLTTHHGPDDVIVLDDEYL